LLAFVVQLMTVYYIFDSQISITSFRGRMHLCDYGAHVSDCPDGRNCIGPGGAQILDEGSLYGFRTFHLRRFWRDILIDIFPDKEEAIGVNVDSGEYGLQSYYCRLLCVFILSIAIAEEFQNVISMAMLLWMTPTEAAKWVSYDVPQWGTKEYVKQLKGMKELDFVSFFVAGIPLHWKIINLIILLIPKAVIGRLFAAAGIFFLMESSDIVSTIVNTTALCFVQHIDELVFERLTTRMTRVLMNNIQDLILFDPSENDHIEDDEMLDHYGVDEIDRPVMTRKLWWLLPRRLCLILFIMGLLVTEYYYKNCDRTESGSWISKEIPVPASSHIKFHCFLRHVGFFSDCVHKQSYFWTKENTG